MDEAFGGEVAGSATLAPAIDVTETDAEYVRSAEVPGVKKNDLTVEVQQGVLTLRGEKKSEREETKERARLIERSWGTFARSFSPPADADAGKVEASFVDGVLNVKIAKRPPDQPKQVAIKE